MVALYEDLYIEKIVMAVKLDSDFEIIWFSDVRYEEIMIEIQFNGEAILQINRDYGVGKLKAEWFFDFVQNDFCPKFRLDDFMIVINKARESVWTPVSE